MYIGNIFLFNFLNYVILDFNIFFRHQFVFVYETFYLNGNTTFFQYKTSRITHSMFVTEDEN